MRAFKYILCAAAILVAAASCVKVKENKHGTEATFLKLVTTGSDTESAVSHDFNIKVICDGEFRVALSDASWAKVTSMEPGSGDATIVNIRCKTNLGESSRSQTLTAVAGNLKETIRIVQKPLDPTEAIPGVWHYGGTGVSIVLDPYLHQTGVERSSAGNSFRIVSPSEGKFLLLKNIPGTIAVGDKFTATLWQNWTSAIPYSADYAVEAVRTEDKLAWLATVGGIIFVVKI